MTSSRGVHMEEGVVGIEDFDRSEVALSRRWCTHRQNHSPRATSSVRTASEGTPSGPESLSVDPDLR